MYERSISLNKNFIPTWREMKRGFSLLYLSLIFCISGNGKETDVGTKTETAASAEAKIQKLEERKKKHVKNRKRHQAAARRGESNPDLSLEVRLEYALERLELDQIESIERQIRKLRENPEN
jgi:hypothetical protein